MSDPKSGAGNDPSMDDILASIRKIISDDEARAQVGGQPAGSAPSTGQSGRPLVTPPAEASSETKLRDDVLLLTDLIEDPRAEAAVAPVPLPRIDPVRAAEMPQPSIEPSKPASPARATVDPALVSGSAASSTASAIARLNQAVQDSVPPPSAQDPGPVIGGNGKTVEDLVKDTLRPMLKEWLDRNLPQIVERHVEREIARLTRR